MKTQLKVDPCQMFVRIVASASLAVYLINPTQRADEVCRRAGFERMCAARDGCRHPFEACYGYTEGVVSIQYMARELDPLR